jgi:hypothetical protein
MEESIMSQLIRGRLAIGELKPGLAFTRVRCDVERENTAQTCGEVWCQSWFGQTGLTMAFLQVTISPI